MKLTKQIMLSKNRKMTGRKILLAILLTVLAVGMTGSELAVSAAGQEKQTGQTGKKAVVRAMKKAVKADTWYTVQSETCLETDGGSITGVTVYVPEAAVKDGKVRKAGSSTPLTTVEMEKAPTAGYYILPEGCQVLADTEIRAVKDLPANLPEGVKESYVYFYLKTGDSYRAIDPDSSFQDILIKADTTVGCDWKVNGITISDYQSATQNAAGEELAGTILEKNNFTVKAEMADGTTVTLPTEDFILTPGTVPLTKDDKCKVTAVLVKDPSLIAEYTLKMTPLRLDGISASCTKTYYVGDIVDPDTLNVQAAYYDVVSKTERAVRLDSSEFTITPETIAVDGVNVLTVTYLDKTAVCEINGSGIKEITVSYTGGDVVVGKEFDTAKVKVTAVYTNGDKKLLKPEEYTFSTTYIVTAGENKINVLYGAYMATFSVTGIERAVEKITAEYTGKDVIEGGTFLMTDVKVIAIFNDGTEERVYDFLLSTTTVAKIGSNKITATYLDKTAEFTVVGVGKQPTSIVAIYHGEPVVAGNDINMNDVEVTAYFNDGSFEVVTDFSLSMTTLTAPGMNMVTVTYKETTTTIYVICIAKQATALEAVYKGPDIVQNSSFSRDYVLVTATFNDGTTEQVTDFILASTMVPNIGVNTYQVTYGTQIARFTVNGIARTITGTGNMEADISNEDYEGITLTAEVSGQLIKENMELGVEVYESKELKRVVRKTTKSGKFIGFELDVDGYEFAENQYMTARITVPMGFDPAKTAVYFTPNRKSVMARMAGGLVAPDVYEFYIYRSGTYVLLESNESMLKYSDLRGNNMDEFIIVSGLKPVMKVGEKLNLTAAVLPLAEGVTPSFTWRVDDTSVAKVTSNGILLAKESGYVELTVKTKDGKLSYTCEIEIVEEE